jgi:hypothetical protein
MEIRALVDNELRTTYKDMFEHVFGEWDDNQNPTFVLVLYDDDGDWFGFFTCYLMNKKSVYIPFVGMRTDKQDQGYSDFGDIFYNFLRKRGIEIITSKIHQFDSRALIVSLKQGWVIYGVERGTMVDGIWVLVSKYIGGEDGVRPSKQSTG